MIYTRFTEEGLDEYLKGKIVEGVEVLNSNHKVVMIKFNNNIKLTINVGLTPNIIIEDER